MQRRSLVFISILSIASARLSAGAGYGDILKEFQGDIFKVARQGKPDCLVRPVSFVKFAATLQLYVIPRDPEGRHSCRPSCPGGVSLVSHCCGGRSAAVPVGKGLLYALAPAMPEVIARGCGGDRLRLLPAASLTRRATQKKRQNHLRTEPFLRGVSAGSLATKSAPSALRFQ